MEFNNYSPMNQAVKIIRPWIEKAEVSGAKSVTVINKEVRLVSSQGNIRDKNEDRVVFALIENQLSTGADLAVAVLSDGMGGMDFGGDAASLATSSFLAYIATGLDTGLKSLISKAVGYSNERVYEFIHGKGGTTLAAILYGSKGCVGINIGDSRIYHVDANKALKQLTTDDTIEGQINQESEKPDSWLEPFAGDSRLAQFVGMGEGLEPRIIDLSEFYQENSGSGFLLTSDGAHYLGNPMLQRMTEKAGSIEELADRIVMTSEWLGGHDNSSAILTPSRITFSVGEEKGDGLRIKVVTLCHDFTLVLPHLNAIMDTGHSAKEKRELAEKSVPIKQINHQEMDGQATKIGEEKEELSAKEKAVQKKRYDKKKRPNTKKKKKKKKEEDASLTFDFISMEADSNDEDSD
jgi:PPM family protein phosphatase